MTIKPFREEKFEDLLISVYQTNEELGAAAAEEAAAVIQDAIHKKSVANVIIATGNSQLTFLKALKTMPIEWSKVNVFHMDEYIGLAPKHSASFPLFIKRHLLDYVQPKAFFPVPGGTQNTAQDCKTYEELLRAHPADLCALGIGENGHLAFNDPPLADFNDPAWVKVVKLDEVSRQQQVGEGHFASLEDVPTHAITLTIPALLAANRILAIVPETRKIDAVYRTLYGPISEECPSSILRKTPHAHLFLDANSAKRIQ